MNQKDIWNDKHSKFKDIRSIANVDLWLEKYKEILDESKDLEIIDLGCGTGCDSYYLTKKGYKVIACDFSESAIENVKKVIPNIKTIKFDMLDGLPFEDDSTKVIIANLSLHYFTKKDTHRILNDIKRVLKINGVLLCRVNSYKDINFFAGEGDEIEKNYYKSPDGKIKKFFDEEQIKEFFDNWKTLSVKETMMPKEKYGKEKYMYEIVVSNS